MDNGHNHDDNKPTTTFFGMEMGTTITYVIVGILVLVFIKQISIVIQAL